MKYNKVIQIANIVTTGNWHNPQRGRIYYAKGICHCLNTQEGGGREPKFMIIKDLPLPTQEEILPRQNQRHRGIRNINFRIIYRLPFGRCRTIGTFIINPHHDCCPTITSSQWQANHYLITIYDKTTSNEV